MRREEIEIGVVCGRFQVFHNDHLKYVLSAKRYCKHLIVGITSSDPSMSPNEQSDINRGRSIANPCTYYERMMIIENVLLGQGLSNRDFHIVPFPIGKPELIRYYVPNNAVCFFTIYDEWGEEKVNRLKKAGFATEILWKNEKKGLSSSFIREEMAKKKDWSIYVPRETYDYMKKSGIDQRISDMMNKTL